MFISILAAVIALGVLIVVHEFGHFLLAKRLGVGVLKFSVGFGPRIFGRSIHGTEYAVSAIPLGGFVKMVGEEAEGEEPVDPRISFSHQPMWKRAAIVPMARASRRSSATFRTIGRRSTVHGRASNAIPYG